MIFSASFTTQLNKTLGLSLGAHVASSRGGATGWSLWAMNHPDFLGQPHYRMIVVIIDRKTMPLLCFLHLSFNLLGLIILC